MKKEVNLKKTSLLKLALSFYFIIFFVLMIGAQEFSEGALPYALESSVPNKGNLDNTQECYGELQEESG